jgi:uncharacterized protein (TIGR00369 family)
MTDRTAALHARVTDLFERARFVQHLGVKVGAVGEGFCECTLEPELHHQQQDGFVHAGVLATLADHTAGGAAITVAPLDRTILSVSFAVQLMRPASGPLRCRADVLRHGKSLVFAEASIFAGDPARVVTRMNITLAVVPPSIGADRGPRRGGP